jgi:rhomboid protease GluP
VIRVLVSDTTVRVTNSVRQAEEWALVLAAAGISHRIASDRAFSALLVPADEAPRAQAALDAYEQEARQAPGAVIHEAAPPYLAWALSMAVGAFLLLFFAVTGSPAASPRWFERGAASARLIVSGEPWRAVTALTLHLDAVHVAGNALAITVLLPAIVQRLGVGVGILFVLLSGTAGNVLAALTQDSRHVSVGASTGIFGAVGMLAALRLFPPRTGRKPRWTVVVAALLLVVLFGTAREADVIGHVLGLVSGGVMGLVGATLRRPLGPSAQWALLALATMAVIGCWRLALR